MEKAAAAHRAVAWVADLAAAEHVAVAAAVVAAEEEAVAADLAVEVPGATQRSAIT